MIDRQLFVHERLMLLGGLPWNIQIAVRVRGTFTEAAMVEALASLQRQHPVLCAGIVKTGRERPRFRTLSPPPPIPLRIIPWADEEDYFRVIAAEIDVPFDAGRGPLVRLVWIRSETVSDFVLVTHHLICDARSTLLLLHQLLERLDRPGVDGPQQREIATIDDIFGGKPVRGLAKLPGMALGAVAGLLLWVVLRPGQQSVAPPPLPTYTFHWEMDEHSTSALQALAKSRQTTVFAALATAFLRAMREIDPAAARNRMVCPIDIRTPIPAIGPEMLFGCPAIVRLSIDRARDDDFWGQARALHADLIKRRAKLRSELILRAAESLHGLVDRLVVAQLRGKRRDDISIAYLGTVDFPGPYETFENVTSLTANNTAPGPDGRSVNVLISRGRLVFCFVSRENVLPRADAERARDLAMALLLVEPPPSSGATSHRAGRSG
ncbi:MAG: condensation domain-containing protein [Janthinobacterium lividum]